MPTPIKYDAIHLYTRYASIDSAALRKYLNDHNIAYNELCYQPDVTQDALAPLNTWVDAPGGGKVQFADMPVLVFDAVLWEAEDGMDKYTKRLYAVKSSDLPADFLTLAVKNS